MNVIVIEQATVDESQSPYFLIVEEELLRVLRILQRRGNQAAHMLALVIEI